MTNAGDEVVTEQTLRRLAGARSFSRGVEYFEAGAVAGLRCEDGDVTAAVDGSRRYRVRLREMEGALAGFCSCPYGRDGAFCKHCVAVGLAWLAAPPSEHGSGAAPSRAELRELLVASGAEELADLLLELSFEDDLLHARLLALTAASGADRSAVFPRLEQAWDRAVDPGDYVRWDEAFGYAAALNEVVAAVEAHETGHGAEVIAFCEHALQGLEKAYELVDDSDGELHGVSERLQALHLAACRATRPDPIELAERLYALELGGEYDSFYGADETYADVLGDAGVARFRECVEECWASVPAVEPGARGGCDGRRQQLARMMERAARAAGDVDAVVAVLARDLSSVHRFLPIAEALLEASRPGEAIEWAERGLAAFPVRDRALLDFLCDRYGEAGRHDEALGLAWRALEEAPVATTYQRVARAAKRARVWKDWREHARDLLRGPSGDGRARSELVTALLWENDVETAWREAVEGGCRRDLWLELAALRELDHPADALEVYRKEIGPAILANDGHTYRGAVAWLEKVGALLERLGREDEFHALVLEVRETYRAKRNLIKRLDERGWIGVRPQTAPRARAKVAAAG